MPSSELVDLAGLGGHLRFDIRYATADNFVGQPVYAEARALLLRPAAEALLRAAARFEALGFGLTIYDGYRPLAVTKKFWEVTPAALRQFVADPALGSKHNRGCAVDLTMHRLAAPDAVIAMPSPFDAFDARAHSDYAAPAAAAGADAAAREAARLGAEAIANRDFLRRVMEEGGEFDVLPHEWWHFNFRGWEAQPILDVPFDAVPRAALPAA
jgi:D-alanyl-D-alanine dipeptidase